VEESFMTTLYKLTDENSRTYNDTQWGPGIEHTASGRGGLCAPGWLHAYTDPLLAVLLNPIHSDFLDPQLWEANGDVGKTENGLKVGCTKLRTTRQLDVPRITTEHRVRFAILCAKQVYHAENFVTWADAWLNGADRSVNAAQEVVRASREVWVEAWNEADRMVELSQPAKEAVARAVAEAAWAARTAACAEAELAKKATRAAAREAARAAHATTDATWMAVESAAWAAVEAARAADSAATAVQAVGFDIIAIAHQACEI
jgi:hypothetical protein